MAQYAFGNGTLWLAATQDALGAAIATPTPVKVGEVQNVSMELARDIKELYGEKSSPVMIGGGKMKYAFKLGFARILGRIFNDCFFGGALVAGVLNTVAQNVPGTVPASSPYEITPTVPGSGTWSKDLGVIDAATGYPLTRVASAPAAGQYSVAAGVYTFAAADSGKPMVINYGYTVTSTQAKALTITNNVMGTLPQFGLDLAMPFNGKQEIWRFPNCVSSKLGMSPKQDDFQTFDMDVSAFADPVTDIIGYMFVSE